MDAATGSSHFIKAFELATCDGALLVKDIGSESLPDDPTDRFYTLIERFGNSSHRVLVLLDFKSFRWSTKHRRPKQGFDSDCSEAAIGLSLDQAKRCQALIITSAAEPDWVAFVPKPYFRIMNQGKDLTRPKYIDYNYTDSTLTTLNPFPPVLAHLVMRKTDLPRMLNDFAEKALDSRKTIYNPYTGRPFERQADLELATVSSFLTGDTGELRLRNACGSYSTLQTLLVSR